MTGTWSNNTFGFCSARTPLSLSQRALSRNNPRTYTPSSRGEAQSSTGRTSEWLGGMHVFLYICAYRMYIIYVCVYVCMGLCKYCISTLMHVILYVHTVCVCILFNVHITHYSTNTDACTPTYRGAMDLHGGIL